MLSRGSDYHLQSGTEIQNYQIRMRSLQYLYSFYESVLPVATNFYCLPTRIEVFFCLLGPSVSRLQIGTDEELSSHLLINKAFLSAELPLI